jgi:hypothetical protein
MLIILYVVVQNNKEFKGILSKRVLYIARLEFSLGMCCMGENEISSNKKYQKADLRVIKQHYKWTLEKFNDISVDK